MKSARKKLQNKLILILLSGILLLLSACSKTPVKQGNTGTQGQTGSDSTELIWWCYSPDGTIPLSNVWGKAVLVERGKRKIKLDPGKGLRLAKVWHKAGRFWRLGLRIKRKIGRIMRGPHRG